MTRPLGGILSDFDGTLADTMESHYLARKSDLAEHGISIDAESYYLAGENSAPSGGLNVR